jgi:hypothetical protein
MTYAGTPEQQIAVDGRAVEMMNKLNRPDGHRSDVISASDDWPCLEAVYRELSRANGFESMGDNRGNSWIRLEIGKRIAEIKDRMPQEVAR